MTHNPRRRTHRPRQQQSTPQAANKDKPAGRHTDQTDRPTKTSHNNPLNRKPSSTAHIQTPNPAFTSAFSNSQSQQSSYGPTVSNQQRSYNWLTPAQSNIGQRLTALSNSEFRAIQNNPPPSFPLPATSATPKPPHTADAKPGVTMGEDGRPKPFCGFCRENHWLDACPQFSNLNKNEKKAFLTKTKRCTKCGRKHATDQCTFKYKCRKCDNNHVSALHDINEQDLLTGPNEIIPNMPPAIPPAVPSTSKNTDQA